MIIFESFSFLWRDDMNALYKEFEEEYGELDCHHQEVKRLVEIEGKIKAIENEIRVNAIVVNTIPVKDSLIGFCVAWKLRYVQKIHQVAQVRLHPSFNNQGLLLKRYLLRRYWQSEIDPIFPRLSSLSKKYLQLVIKPHLKPIFYFNLSVSIPSGNDRKSLAFWRF